MKTVITILFICICSLCNAQFLDKLGKRAERAVERTVENRVDREATKSTDRALDTLIDGPKKSKKEQRRESKNKQKDGGNVIGGNDSNTNNQNNGQNQPSYSVSSNFDFEPGNVVIFEDNFNRDNAGDFPAKWDTNGSGEIVTINGEKWFRLSNSAMFIPMVAQKLPENYTIEFDLFTSGLDNSTSSQAMLTLYLSDNGKYKRGNTWSMVELSPCQFITSQGSVEKVVNGTREIRNGINKDLRKAINGKSKISISVNKSRMRVWMNDDKIVDIPRLVGEGITNFKMATRDLRGITGLDEIHINNFRIAKTGQDERSKLLTEGRLSTNAILFNTGSATIKSGSEAILKEVGEAMQSATDMRIMIVGHTDADGDANSNLKLSEERAKSVRQELVNKYGISMGRIQTDGKGESSPVADNNSSSGKEQNRRVEFIKL
ncbi:OmpA family protein [Aequorivita lipolytica]|uniref:OmpA family protein n=1 Tax=Aequorivita lipolytica TaxID=153267 RepID=A0A5C6YRJ0_9FLAO|nr:OmpA family protein [Aequorivita lipolytica]TXD69970.1 OmpA family protein [Aequorivita lipolytica]SRX50205.1 Outer membrane porin F [Aequorivita lipolytica]